ncbi:MAG: MFS transporter, partial [Acidimicrobiia bacterium]|nr:MFS transporter [Acidimicrobiia bacterium]
MATIAIPKPTLAQEDTSRHRIGRDWSLPLRDLAEGFSFVTRTRNVRRVVFGMAVALFGGSSLLPLGQSFAADVLQGGDTGFGVLVTALGIG